MSTEAVLWALNERGIRYVVIGGVAAVAHGSAYITDDIDICYDSSPDNRERLAPVLVNWHAYLRGAEPGLPFVLDSRALRDNHVLTLETDEGKLDLIDEVSGVGGYAEVLAASEETVLFGAPTRILSLDGLIASKRAAGRVKDYPLLVELEALREKLRGGRPPTVKEARRRPRRSRRLRRA